MLRGITWETFLEWQAFESLEPFETERQDYRIAHVVHALWTIARAQIGNTEERPIADFLLNFGDLKIARADLTVKQTVEYQEMLIDSWCFLNNAALAAAAKGVH